MRSAPFKLFGELKYEDIENRYLKRLDEARQRGDFRLNQGEKLTPDLVHEKARHYGIELPKLHPGREPIVTRLPNGKVKAEFEVNVNGEADLLKTKTPPGKPTITGMVENSIAMPGNVVTLFYSKETDRADGEDVVNEYAAWLRHVREAIANHADQVKLTNAEIVRRIESAYKESERLPLDPKLIQHAIEARLRNVKDL